MSIAPTEPDPLPLGNQVSEPLPGLQIPELTPF